MRRNCNPTGQADDTRAATDACGLDEATGFFECHFLSTHLICIFVPEPEVRAEDVFYFFAFRFFVFSRGVFVFAIRNTRKRPQRYFGSRISFHQETVELYDRGILTFEFKWRCYCGD